MEEERDTFFAGVIMDCWAQDASERPSFVELSLRFDEAAALPRFQPMAASPTASPSNGVAFVSWRMSECKTEVKALQTALEAKGVGVIVVGELPGGDLLQAVTKGMDEADLFIIMGTETYGRQTSGIIDTYAEMQKIKISGKPFFLFNMNPEKSLLQFKEATTNMVFPLATISWERWDVGALMPVNCIDKVLQKLAEIAPQYSSVPPAAAVSPPDIPTLHHATNGDAGKDDNAVAKIPSIDPCTSLTAATAATIAAAPPSSTPAAQSVEEKTRNKAAKKEEVKAQHLRQGKRNTLQQWRSALFTGWKYGIPQRAFFILAATARSCCGMSWIVSKCVLAVWDPMHLKRRHPRLRY
jgi:hypothetical protein